MFCVFFVLFFWDVVVGVLAATCCILAPVIYHACSIHYHAYPYPRAERFLGVNHFATAHTAASRWSGDFALGAGTQETIWFSSVSNFLQWNRWPSFALSAMGEARPRLDTPRDFSPIILFRGIPISTRDSTSHSPPLSVSMCISHWYFQ